MQTITIKTVMCITPDGRYVNPDGSEIHDSAPAVQQLDRSVFKTESMPKHGSKGFGIVICGSSTWRKLAVAAYSRGVPGAKVSWWQDRRGSNNVLRKLTNERMIGGVLPGRWVLPVGKRHRIGSVLEGLDYAFAMCERAGGVITIAGGAGVWKEWCQLWSDAGYRTVLIDRAYRAGCMLEIVYTVCIVGGDRLAAGIDTECDGWSYTTKLENGDNGETIELPRLYNVDGMIGGGTLLRRDMSAAEWKLVLSRCRVPRATIAAATIATANLVSEAGWIRLGDGDGRVYDAGVGGAATKYIAGSAEAEAVPLSARLTVYRNAWASEPEQDVAWQLSHEAERAVERAKEAVASKSHWLW